jgi:5'-nucleotidase
MNNHPVGGVPVMAPHPNATMASGKVDGIIVVLPGDVMEGSPTESGPPLEEPSMLFFNSFANQHCTFGSQPQDASCNMVATQGNRDFNYGVPELTRRINGGKQGNEHHPYR